MESHSSSHLPQLTNNISGIQTLEEENSWRSAFYREKEKLRDRFSSLREPIDLLTTPKLRNIQKYCESTLPP